MWCPLYQVQWDISFELFSERVKEHYLYNRPSNNKTGIFSSFFCMKAAVYDKGNKPVF